jgi:hypothetical protein
MINLKTVNFEKLDKLTRVNIPGTETNQRLSGYFGYFESREGYNKLIAYGPEEKAFQLSWIHNEYLKK